MIRIAAAIMTLALSCTGLLACSSGLPDVSHDSGAGADVGGGHDGSPGTPGDAAGTDARSDGTVHDGAPDTAPVHDAGPDAARVDGSSGSPGDAGTGSDVGTQPCSVTCTSGCCDDAGTCNTAETVSACGTGGKACETCTGGTACTSEGTCACATTCGDAGACIDTMADMANCGGCGNSCGGGACAAGVCQVNILQTGLYYPAMIAVDDGSIFFTDGTAGEIQRMSKTGGAAPAPLLMGQGTIAELKAGGSRVLWSSSTTGGVLSAADDGSGTVTAISPAPAAWTVHGTSLYWFTADTAVCTCTGNGSVGGQTVSCSSTDLIDCGGTCNCSAHTGALYTANLDGTGTAEIGTGGLENIFGIAVNSTAVYGAYSDFKNPPCFNTLTAIRCALTGTAPEPFTAVPWLDVDEPAFAGADDHNVYVETLSQACASSMFQTSRAIATGGAWSTVSGVPFTAAFAAGATRDFAILSGGSLISFAQTGSTGTPTTLYATASHLALDAQFVYFTDYANGSLGIVRQQ
jgi:hypothetical protein